jgi:hypothetical protein
MRQIRLRDKIYERKLANKESSTVEQMVSYRD